jgi:hypothetical protein
VATASAAPNAQHERAAVIDLGPADGGAARHKLATAIVAAGLDPVIGDGVDEALAGIAIDKDGVALQSAVANAERAFGQLACGEARTAATAAIPLGAERQAAGLPVPELSRALTYVLLCADREGDSHEALTAAARLRALGDTSNVDAAVLARYPTADVVLGVEQLELDITAEVAGAAIWIDLAPAGVSPLHVTLPAGDHVIAAASGTKRGAVIGTVVKTQPSVTIAMPDVAGGWTELATRVASWHGQLPAAGEIAWALAQVHARVAVIRYGDAIEAWGQAGRTEDAHRLGGEDGIAKLAGVDRLLALTVDRVRGWSDHAPDPDRPLMVDADRVGHRTAGGREEGTRWWVYAVVGGALAAAAIAIYAHDQSSDTQHIELKYP